MGLSTNVSWWSIPRIRATSRRHMTDMPVVKIVEQGGRYVVLFRFSATQRRLPHAAAATRATQHRLPPAAAATREAGLAVAKKTKDMEDLIKAAGFRWDPHKQEWWTTDLRVIDQLDAELRQRAMSERLRSIQVLYHEPLAAEVREALDPLQPRAVQLRSILARPPGTPAGASEGGSSWQDLPAIGPGWVYVLTNEAHPHFVKIGHSTDAPENRAAEIHSTGVPLPFIVEFKIYVSECGGLEAAVHERLKDARVNPRREFFRISAPEAARCIAEIAVEWATSGSQVIAYIRENDVLKRIEPSDRPNDDGTPPGRRPAA